MVFRFIRFFGCWKPDGVTFLFWFVLSGTFIKLGNQVQSFFQKHTKKCRIHWLNDLGWLGVTWENSAFCVIFRSSTVLPL